MLVMMDLLLPQINANGSLQQQVGQPRRMLWKGRYAGVNFSDVQSFHVILCINILKFYKKIEYH